MRLDKVLKHYLGWGKSDVRQSIARGEVLVNGEAARDNLLEVSTFCEVAVKGEVIQGKEAQYIMLHKPAGCVSATEDPEHQTVIDLIDAPFASNLHIAGRLDKESTGLLILTNNGQWSRLLTEPEFSVPKRYRVRTEHEISPDYAEQFSQGIYFAYEDITTLPAQLEIISNKVAEITIHEGKYHQIKRMFHAVGNRVTALHRISIGNIMLGDDLQEGEWRRLTDTEINQPT